MSREQLVLVLAPSGRDADLVCATLRRAGIEARSCRDITSLCDEYSAGAGLLVVAEEALDERGLRELASCLADQPSWSDLPLIVLTGGGFDDAAGRPLRLLGGLGNVMMLERPTSAPILVNAARVGLRARQRQYDLRTHIREREEAARTRAALLEREQAARVDAEAANRLKDDFLATLSHELRTPLNAILGWMTLLRRGDLPSEKRQHALEVIERNARLQTKLIEDLLDVSRIIQGKLSLHLTAVDVSGLVDSVADSIRPAADAKQLRVEIPRQQPPEFVRADAERLHQVIWNLLSNAAKFTPAGGRIRVETGVMGDDLEIAVEDNGPGIPPDVLPFVFDRFRQANSTPGRTHGGLGLGLAIVRHLVELHGGTVRAENVTGGCGARFVVTLRRHLPRPQDGMAAAIGTDGAKGSTIEGRRILVVDDDPDALELMRDILEGQGATVLRAASAAEALQDWTTRAPDLLISDIGMPEEDGYSLIRRVRRLDEALGRHTPAVALTAYAQPRDVERALKAGYERHVSKPLEVDSLLGTLRDLAQQLPPA